MTEPSPIDDHGYRIAELRDSDIEGGIALMNASFREILSGFGIPLSGRSEGDRCGLRFAHPSAKTAVALDAADRVVAIALMVRYGSLVITGPMASIHPSAGASIWAQAGSAIAGVGASELSLVTFPQSIGHHRLYQPLHDPLLTPMCPALALSRAVEPRPSSTAGPANLRRFSELGVDERWAALESSLELTSRLRGLDLRPEIRHIEAQGIGDTLLWMREGEVSGLACCHYGPRSEAFSDSQLLIKIAYAGGPEREQVFADLIDGAERSASSHGLTTIATMVPAWRRGPLLALRERGYQPRELHQYFHGELRASGLSFEARTFADEYLLTEMR